MALFILAFWLGVRMLDSLRRPPPKKQEAQSNNFLQALNTDWNILRVNHRRWILITGIFWLISLLIYVFFQGGLQTLFANLVAQAFNAEPGTPLNTLFSLIASNQNASALANYQDKAISLLKRGGLLGLILYLLIWVLWVSRQLHSFRTYLNYKTPSFLGNRRIIIAADCLVMIITC